MKYEIYNQMQEGSFVKGAEESEQEYMERTIRAVCEMQPEGEITSMNDMMAPELASCDADTETLCLRFQPQAWQLNPNGTLHGGMIATAIDITFGVLSRFYAKSSKLVTIDLNISYMRPIPRDADYLVTASIRKNGRRVKFLHADVRLADSGKLAAEGTAMFM